MLVSPELPSSLPENWQGCAYRSTYSYSPEGNVCSMQVLIQCRDMHAVIPDEFVFASVCVK